MISWVPALDIEHYRSVRPHSGGMARIRGEIGPLLRRERHSVRRETACDFAHCRGTGNLPPPEDSSVPEEAGQTDSHAASDLASKHYNPKPSPSSNVSS